MTYQLLCLTLRYGYNTCIWCNRKVPVSLLIRSIWAHAVIWSLDLDVASWRRQSSPAVNNKRHAMAMSGNYACQPKVQYLWPSSVEPSWKVVTPWPFFLLLYHSPSNFKPSVLSQTPYPDRLSFFHSPLYVSTTLMSFWPPPGPPLMSSCNKSSEQEMKASRVEHTPTFSPPTQSICSI